MRKLVLDKSGKMGWVERLAALWHGRLRIRVYLDDDGPTPKSIVDIVFGDDESEEQ